MAMVSTWVWRVTPQPSRGARCWRTICLLSLYPFGANVEEDILTFGTRLKERSFFEALDDEPEAKRLQESPWCMPSSKDLLPCKVLYASNHVCKDVGPLGERMLQQQVHRFRTALHPNRFVFGLVRGDWEIDPSGELKVEGKLHPADPWQLVGVRLPLGVRDPVEVLENRF